MSSSNTNAQAEFYRILQHFFLRWNCPKKTSLMSNVQHASSVVVTCSKHIDTSIVGGILDGITLLLCQYSDQWHNASYHAISKLHKHGDRLYHSIIINHQFSVTTYEEQSTFTKCLYRTTFLVQLLNFAPCFFLSFAFSSLADFFHVLFVFPILLWGL